MDLLPCFAVSEEAALKICNADYTEMNISRHLLILLRWIYYLLAFNVCNACVVSTIIMGGCRAQYIILSQGLYL